MMFFGTWLMQMAIILIQHIFLKALSTILLKAADATTLGTLR
jgi:hypothetical protein